MALCINQSGTYRNIKTLCIKEASTYRELRTGCINQTGTYRLFTCGFTPALGSSYEGGLLMCREPSQSTRWIASPVSAEVSRTWYCRNDANTRAQQVSGCTGWFVPNGGNLQDPGFVCRCFWGAASGHYWSCADRNSCRGCMVKFSGGGQAGHYSKCGIKCVRAFRCVTY